MNTLALTAVVSVVVAALYLYVGRVVHSRAVSAEARLARDAFATWWALLGGMSLLGALQTALYLSDRLPIWLYLTFTQIALWALFAALCSLQLYLVYLYTGSKRSFVPIGAFYLVAYFAIIALLHWAGRPESIYDDGWRLRTLPQVELGRAVGIAFILLLLGPQLFAAVSYARLYRKTQDRTQRYRIAMLTGSILVWFGTSAVVGAASSPDAVNVPWQIAQRLLSIAAALAILMAYKPPRWVRDRWGLRALDEPEAALMDGGRLAD